ncbi:MAG: hypothetical protein KIT60_29965 [Burkholderiaceae bacterium]|nr:hypothetical protein [Burkholderiaceae bacterium]
MVEVFFTIDVEVWCDGWQDIDARFPAAFERYIYGPGRQGGLPDQLQILRDHGLMAVCFVEPLFSGRFGAAPLEEVVGLIRDAGHEVQMHLHTEWVDEARVPMLPAVRRKRQHLRHFDRAEQCALVRQGIAMLQGAGALRPTAFRAGSFAMNADTLAALADNGIAIDCSYNASTMGPSSGVCPGETLDQARQLGPVLELPMTVYADGRGLRHTQLTACSWGELQALLWQAADRGHGQFVVLSHNFELLTPGLQRVDPIVLRRLRRLAAFLDRHRDRFRVRGLLGDAPTPPSAAPRHLRSPLWRTGARVLEQAWRRTYSR